MLACQPGADKEPGGLHRLPDLEFGGILLGESSPTLGAQQ